MYRYIKIPSLESLTSVSKSFELNCLGVLIFNKLFQQIWRLINWRCLWFCPSLCFNGFVCLVNGQVNTRRQFFLQHQLCFSWLMLHASVIFSIGGGGGSESSQVVFLQPQVLRRWGRLAPSETWFSALIGWLLLTCTCMKFLSLEGGEGSDLPLLLKLKGIVFPTNNFKIHSFSGSSCNRTLHTKDRLSAGLRPDRPTRGKWQDRYEV